MPVLNDHEKWVAAGRRTIKGMRLDEPRVMGIEEYLVLIAERAPGRVRQVPTAAIEEDGHEGDETYALLRCPCGSQPAATGKLARCPGCERYYLCVALGRVYVVYGEMTPPAIGCADVAS